MYQGFRLYVTHIKFRRLTLFCAAVVVGFSTVKSRGITAAQKVDDIVPMWAPLHPVAAPGEHIRRRLIGLIGVSGPVTLDIVQGKQDGFKDEHPLAPQVCVAGSGPKSCFVPRGPAVHYIIVQVEPLQIAPGRRVLLLRTGKYDVHETIMLTSFVAMGRKGRLVDILPEVVSSVLQDEVGFWRDPAVSPDLIVSKAEALDWEGDDSFFGRHVYQINAYTYCLALRRYTEAIYFNLARKIPGLDPWHSENFVLNKVRPGIKRRLLQRKRTCTALSETTSR